MATTQAAPKLIHQTDVLHSKTGGYHTMRIPTIATAADGSIVVVSEARLHGGDDPGVHGNEIHLVCKRSADDGATWSPLSLVDNPGERWSVCNPTLLLDRETERLWLFHARTKPDRSGETSRAGTDDTQANVRYSDDHGRTWSEARDVTDISRDVATMRSAFFGPGGAIQTSSGRLLAPISRTTAEGATNAYAIFSDDHGGTWHRGQVLPGGDWGNESQFIELADGRILIDVRQNEGDHRWRSTSTDGGETWSKPTPALTVTPVACGIVRATPIVGGSPIVWTCPSGPGRKNLAVRISTDECESFSEEFPLYQGYACYSDLTMLPDGTVGIIWERGVDHPVEYITFTRLSLV